MKKQATLKEYIEHYGYTIKEWNETVDTLCKKGVSKGCYQDYNLLTLVIGWLYNYCSVIELDDEVQK